MRGSIRRTVQACLRGAPEAVGLEPPMLSPAERATIARLAWRDAGRHWRQTWPRELAAALGLILHPVARATCGDEVMCGNRIFYVWQDERRLRDVLILHAIAHWLLRHHEHTESDAWLLTAEMVAPHDAVADLHLRDRAPDWFLLAWSDAARLIADESRRVA